MNEKLLSLYHQELAFIRDLGAEFAQAHPKIAGRLRADDKIVEDPHISRLIEAFALLNARTQANLDQDFSQLNDALLDILYPNYLASIPAMSIVQFTDHLTPKEKIVPSQTSLYTDPIRGSTCHFTSCYPVSLWPITVSRAQLISPFDGLGLLTQDISQLKSALCLSIEPTIAIAMADLDIDKLRFYINAPAQQAHLFYELLFNHTISIAIADSAHDPKPIKLKPSNLLKVGYAKEERLLPYEARNFAGYNLWLEFFALPEKFLFFDLINLKDVLKTKASGLKKSVEIYFYFDSRQSLLENKLNADYFKLGCTPIINLFRQTAEPTLLDYAKTEIPILANTKLPQQANEIYCIESVVATSQLNQKIDYQPFYKDKYTAADRTNSYWHASRETVSQKKHHKLSSTGMTLAFSHPGTEIDLDQKHIMIVETISSNGALPNHLPFGGGEPYLRFSKKPSDSFGIDCLMAIKPAKRLSNVKECNWRLAAYLSLNQLSLTDDKNNLAMIKEILKLHSVTDKDDLQILLDGLIVLKHNSVTTRNPNSRFNSFWQGSQFTLEVDESKFSGTGLYFFASVLENFLALYSSLNTFTQLIVISKQRGELYRWLPRE